MENDILKSVYVLYIDLTNDINLCKHLLMWSFFFHFPLAILICVCVYVCVCVCVFVCVCIF